MDIGTILSPHRFGLLLSSEARREGWAGSLKGAVRRGEAIRLRPGVHLPRTTWDGMDASTRYLARIHAVALTIAGPVFCLESAAALHDLPLIGPEHTQVHLLQTTASGSGTRSGVTIHAHSGPIRVSEHSGLLLTSPADTVVDMARRRAHHQALAIADAAVRVPDARDSRLGQALCTKDELVRLAQELAGLPGANRALAVVSEADGLSGSVGESYARSLMLRMGAPHPLLQVPFYDSRGLAGIGDFFWREYGVLAEFDGRVKYSADNPSGLTPEEVVYREKLREDRLRRLCRIFVRFGWADLREPGRLAHLLRSAGVPFDRRAAWPEFRATTPA